MKNNISKGKNILRILLFIIVFIIVVTSIYIASIIFKTNSYLKNKYDFEYKIEKLQYSILTDCFTCSVNVLNPNNVEEFQVELKHLNVLYDTYEKEIIKTYLEQLWIDEVKNIWGDRATICVQINRINNQNIYELSESNLNKVLGNIENGKMLSITTNNKLTKKQIYDLYFKTVEYINKYELNWNQLSIIFQDTKNNKKYSFSIGLNIYKDRKNSIDEKGCFTEYKETVSTENS